MEPCHDDFSARTENREEKSKSKANLHQIFLYMHHLLNVSNQSKLCLTSSCYKNMAASKETMKLTTDTKSKRVICAEAGKKCIDFLFQILSLPMGSRIGCVGNSYECLENFANMFIEPNQNKVLFLKPISSSSIPLLLLTNTPVGETKKQFYRCQYNCNYVTDDPKTLCPSHSSSMTCKVDYVSRPAGNVAAASTSGGVDNLVIMKPMSRMTLLNEFSFEDVVVLKGKYVTLDEALKLIKTSLQSESVLTTVFINNITE